MAKTKWGGLVPPDDPMFTEGATIVSLPRGWRPSPKRSGSDTAPEPQEEPSCAPGEAEDAGKSDQEEPTP